MNNPEIFSPLFANDFQLVIAQHLELLLYKALILWTVGMESQGEPNCHSLIYHAIYFCILHCNFHYFNPRPSPHHIMESFFNADYAWGK